MFDWFLFQIWDIQDEHCLFTADPTVSGLHGDLSACMYSPEMKTLYIAADSIAVLPLEMRLVPMGFLLKFMKHKYTF